MNSIRKFFLKKESGRPDFEKIIFIAVVVTAYLVYVIINEVKRKGRDEVLNNTARYTIGITTGSSSMAKGPRTIDYKFSVGNIVYKKWNYYPTNKHDIVLQEERYFVRFAKDDPENAEMLFECVVPDGIKAVPDTGWAKLPVDCKR